MADLFQADALDEEQLEYIQNEFFAGFKRYKNSNTLPAELEKYSSLDDSLKHQVSINLCRELQREQKNNEGMLLKHFIDDVQNVYTSDNRPWVIGYSGGKDSSAVVTLIYLALLSLEESKRTKPVYVVASDTLVETPLVVDHVNKSLDSIGKNAKRDGLPLTTHKVLPKPHQTFWSCLLGKGYPAPTQSFRWCTERMKIDPVSDFIKDKVSQHDEVIVILGSRSQESASRAQVIAKHKIENTRLARHTTLANAFIYTPIDTWSMDDVWKLIRACSLEVTISPMGIGKKWSDEYDLEWENPWGGKNLTLWNLYKDSSDQGECPMVIDDSTPSCGNSRFGCWTCTVVTKDRAMESLIQNGEEWMQPLLTFRNKLAETNVPANKDIYRNYKRRVGKVNYQRVKDGQELSEERAHVPGPYWLKFRKEWLTELLVQQREFNKEGYSVTLVTEPELHAIRQEWLNDPNEPDWADSLPKIYREVFGVDLNWVINDNSSFGEIEAQILLDLGEQYNVEPEMVQKLLDLELSLEGLSRRTGVFDKIATLLRQDWGTLEEIKQRHAQLQSKSDFDIHKDQIDKYEQELLELEKQAKVEL
ncbi:DNA phosphorothioation system sulfurtransferase DndC [Shewanella sp. 1_MG-2023]|uniref:DNA phosphorothioation system sulfurtransferase DndC n=1 Tax=unclassified Shewanella TaxID=196818 RepID=UPI0026E1A494|nr:MULTISPECIES: DNA phosphorothioation system sulfurtransferase DndC [unclassified Shewanella]MDO6610515.1 DNA phosphorothioation system sulfurtransferase DndC [Shewanella sp. 7_MG-2023]MDO6770640.1 DNA phosphorothioation system sulfurtransferase DndC [Shewanella sp. 2_MG-2023]MDO6795026.1 DNA phosphorothioation system sulfurtransferase DndC [Shewanella sp. 1_MG-2023]